MISGHRYIGSEAWEIKVKIFIDIIIIAKDCKFGCG